MLGAEPEVDVFGCDAFSPWSLEFFACEERITIVPSVGMPVLHLLRGNFGPFRPNRRMVVPVWLALNLQQRGRCRVVPPAWMDVENLSAVRRDERKDSEVFQPLPFHYIEIAHLLLRDSSYAHDTFGGGATYSQVSALVEDIRQIRRHKIKTGLSNLKEATPAVKLNNLSAMEVNQIREFLSGSLETYHALEVAEANSAEGATATISSSLNNLSDSGTPNESQTMPRQLRR